MWTKMVHWFFWQLYFWYFTYILVSWYEEESELSSFKLGPPSNLGPPVFQGYKASPLSLPFEPPNIILPETILMVRWMKSTSEFDQP